MMTKDQAIRPTAEELLTHRWFEGCEKEGACGAEDSGETFLSLIASQLTSKDSSEKLRERMEELDLDNDGLLSREEILSNLPLFPLPESVTAKHLSETMDSDLVDYQAFMSEAIEWLDLLSPARVEAVFQYYDANEGKVEGAEVRRKFAACRKSVCGEEATEKREELKRSKTVGGWERDVGK